jgi:hypothetical protein
MAALILLTFPRQPKVDRHARELARRFAALQRTRPYAARMVEGLINRLLETKRTELTHHWFSLKPDGRNVLASFRADGTKLPEPPAA